MSQQLLLLRDLIQERSGLFFDDFQGVCFLEGRLESLMKKSGCGSLSEYYILLKDGEKTAAAGEWLRLIADLSKPVSSFVRHTGQTQALINTVMPKLASVRGSGRLKIWSAGCATGEEPLSITMALLEAGWFDRFDIEIYASDASTIAIEKARQGIYSDLRVRYLSDELRLKYFTPLNDEWQINPELHKRIHWSVANLINESEIADFAASDIIFCRNVFIYFSESAIRQTLRLFEKKMPADGYLFTDGGDYLESLMAGIDIFERQEISRASVWIKRD
jgi:chemotaxis protein methyltransferase CheR